MQVLAAVGDRETRRVGEAVRRILIRSLHLRVLKSGCCFEHTWRRAALVQPCSLRHSAETHPEGSTAVGLCSYPSSGGTGSSNLFLSSGESVSLPELLSRVGNPGFVLEIERRRKRPKSHAEPARAAGLLTPALKVAVTDCRYRARVPIWG
jgi:hypothetical protein